MRTVRLGGKIAAGRVALVDDEDYDLVMQYTWHVLEEIRGARTYGPYARTNVYLGGRRRTIGMHKLITGWPQTDHADRNGLNNQRSNLRPATTIQNTHNQRPQTGRSSAFKGVRWHPGKTERGGRWAAAIKLNGTVHYLGHFLSEEDAARAYDAAARELHGEFAYTNF
jgi:hypothetical protein